MRLLVKARGFLAQQSFAHGTPESTISVDESDTKLSQIYLGYQPEIEGRIREILSWLLQASMYSGPPLSPFNAFNSWTSYRKHCDAKVASNGLEGTQACWVTMSLWYAFKNCEEIAASILKDKLRQFQLQTLLKDLTAIIEDPYFSEKGQEIENSFLRFYHYVCLSQLIDICEPIDSLKLEASRIELEVKKYRIKVQDIVNPTRKARSHRSSPKQELEDRLALLAKELYDVLVQPNFTRECDSYVAQRIAMRSYTSQFNPGCPIPNDPAGEAFTDAPWELTCLNHHTSLQLSIASKDDARVNKSKAACYEFSMSDYAFISSWDESIDDMLGSWWNTEISSVVCSTLIDVQNRGKIKNLLGICLAKILL